jgi:CRISPR-associated protein Csb3
VAEASIPVDLWNPGQVFACIGFVEAADVLLGGAEGAFDWSDASDVRFRIRARGEESPIGRVLRFLEQAEAFAEAPSGSPSLEKWTDSWGARPREIDRSLGYPFPEPSSPATYVCILRDGVEELRLEHWGDGTERDNVKFWGGAGGFPGAARARDALGLFRGHASRAVSDPFAFSRPQSSSFRLDWRRDYVPIDVGFSLNKHDDIKSVGFPIVELLAALGLTNARPLRAKYRRQELVFLRGGIALRPTSVSAETDPKLVYGYGVVGRAGGREQGWLPLAFLRAALGGSPLPFPSRQFRMLLGWPTKEDQDRAITTVTEETVA